MKRFFVFTMLALGICHTMRAQSNTILLDELLERIEVGMTEKEYFKEFDNELRLLDSTDMSYALSEDLISSFLYGTSDIQQKASDIGAIESNPNKDTIINESSNNTWVIDVEVNELGHCLAFTNFNDDGCMLVILPHGDLQNMQSSYLFKKAKNALNKYATSDIIELMGTDNLTLYSGIWSNGALMILQSISETQCITVLAFQFTSKSLNAEDMKLAAQYFKTGELPEEEPTTTDSSFEFPSIRVAKWGDSMATVMKKEGKYDELTKYNMQNGDANHYVFYDKINRHDCTVTYAFDDSDRAYIVIYTLSNISKESCITTFNNLKYSLTKKYGEPTNDEINKRYEWTKEEWQQVYYGNLSYETSWVTDDFVHITLDLDTFNDRISCYLRYVYLPLYMIQQEKESSNL